MHRRFAAFMLLAVLLFLSQPTGAEDVDISFVGLLRYSALHTGDDVALVDACPYPVEIMRHTVKCDLEAFAYVGFDWANEVGPGNRSAEGYQILDLVTSFVGANPGTVPVNDLWVHPDNKTGLITALVGTGNGFSVVDVTVPQEPVESGFFGGFFTVWRDVKVWSTETHTYAYVVHDMLFGMGHLASLTNVAPSYKAPYETGDGLLIVDITLPQTPVLVKYDTSAFEFAHNIFIEPDRPYAYVCGGDVTKGLGSHEGGIRVLDLSDPANPVTVATWADVYIHDLVVQYRADLDKYILYGCGINEAVSSPSLFFLDASDPVGSGLTTAASPVATTYPYAHNTWPTDDASFLYVTHEDMGGPISVFDIRDLDAVVEVDDLFLTPGNVGISPHNVFVVGSQLWASYYTEGVTVYDITNPGAPVLAGTFDTSHLVTGFSGAWGIFPFLLDNEGLFYVSDIEHGLFVLRATGVDAPPPPAPLPSPPPPAVAPSPPPPSPSPPPPSTTPSPTPAPTAATSAPVKERSLAGPYALGSLALILGIAAVVGVIFLSLRRSAAAAAAQAEFETEFDALADPVP